MSRRLGTDSDVEKLARRARKAKFTVEVTRGNHIKWTAPNGDVYISALTFGDRRRIKSVEKFLRTHGMEI